MGADVNTTLTVFLLAPVVPYSSGVQQPMRATAIAGGHPHAHCAAQFAREQGRADSLHPDGLAALAAFWPPKDAQSCRLLRTNEHCFGRSRSSGMRR